jgi:hypothetical protein
MKNFLIDNINNIITIIGFIVSWIFLKMGFSNALKEKRDSERIKLYSDWYSALYKFINNDFAIFDKEEFSKILTMKSEIDLFSSNEMIKSFNKVLNYLNEVHKKYVDYDLSIDPRNDKTNYECGYDESGNYYEICHIQNYQLDDYENDIYDYKKKNVIDKNKRKEILLSILNEMRKEIGNDKLKKNEIF